MMERTLTTLREVGRALNELRFEHEHPGTFVTAPQQELKVLDDLFRYHAAAIGKHVDEDLCELAAWLILNAMLAQQDCKRDFVDAASNTTLGQNDGREPA
jgi:hypothetical protein